MSNCSWEGVSYSIVMAVLEYYMARKSVQIIPFTDTSDQQTKIWINDDEEGTSGWVPTCRYLARVSASYTPPTPDEALISDGCICLLQSFVSAVDQWAANASEQEGYLKEHLGRLERHLQTNGSTFVVNASPDLADLCRYGALEWAKDENFLPADAVMAVEYPRVFKWSQGLHLSYGEIN